MTKKSQIIGFICLFCLISCGDDATGADASRDGDPSDTAADTATDVAADLPADVAADLPTDADDLPDATVDPGGDGFFPDSVAWAQPVDGAPAHPNSDAIIAWLDDKGGWGNGGRFQIDFTIEVLEADGSPRRSFEPTEEFYSPDCDPAPIPVPAAGNLEGEEGYACVGDGDCHLIVVDRGAARLYEMWRANIEGESFEGGCLAIWDLSRDPGVEGRGLHCTSADAAGLPIAPLLFTADEVAAGEITHAIRFILPNPRIQNRAFVAPATHSTGATGGGEDAPAYGARLRLRADYPLESLPSEGARVVARALQRYGMILADAGQIALTARSDRTTSAKWEDHLGPRDLDALSVTDFEVVDSGPTTAWEDCERAPITD